MSNIQGPGEGASRITPHDKALYENEYRHGVDLFQRALTEYTKTDEIHKKDAFREVMDRTMQVLNDAARELKRTDLMDQNKKISDSFQGLQANEMDPSMLAQNLKDAKKAV
jgi:hypothetical protein